MSKFLPAHAAIAALLTNQAIRTPTDIAFGRGLVASAQATWYPPQHRNVVTTALGTLKDTTSKSRVSGKAQFEQDIADAMKAIAAQPAEMPHVQNGAGGDQPHQTGHGQPREQRTSGH